MSWDEDISMNNAEENTQPMGLDVGTSRIVVGAEREGKYEYDRSSMHS